MTKDDEYTNIILEEIRDQNKAVLEAVGQMQDKMDTLVTKEDLARIDTKVDTIATAVRDTNKDVAGLDQRVTALEQAS